MGTSEKDKVKQKAKDVEHKAYEEKGKAESALSRTFEKAKEFAGRVEDKAKELADKVKDKGKELADKAKQSSQKH